MVTWASGLGLHGANWPEAQRSLWAKDRRMINPDTRVTKGEQGQSLTPLLLPVEG